MIIEHNGNKKFDEVMKVVSGIPHTTNDASQIIQLKKLKPKSQECILLGSRKGLNGFKLWDLINKKKILNRDVIFNKVCKLMIIYMMVARCLVK